MTNQRRYLIGIVVIGCALAMLLLLWHEDYSAFWTVLLGAAYLWFDKIEEKEEKE
jgi:hypothetical protein